MSETFSILVLLFGMFFFAIFAIFIVLYVVVQKKKQFKHKIEKQEMQHKFGQQLMQSRLEVQEQTLKHLSQELHDNVAQLLGIAKMNLHELVQRCPQEQRPIAIASAEMVGSAIKDIRAMSHMMNGTYVLNKGLKESIEKDLQHISSAQRIKCNFTTTGDATGMNEERELLIFRIIQEAVSNAVKHGKPGQIDVSLEYHPGALQVRIIDNGNGFDVQKASAAKAGIGLSNMDARVTLLDGSMCIESAINTGTTISLNIPVYAKDDKSSHSG